MWIEAIIAYSNCSTVRACVCVYVRALSNVSYSTQESLDCDLSVPRMHWRSLLS